MEARGRAASRLGVAGAIAVLCAIAAATTFPLLACPDACLVDYEAVHGGKLGKLERPDARLNAWILAWVQHALLTNPAGLFDANIFHPLRNTLSQSEHLLGVAIPLLPLRFAGTGAVALHQLAIVLSALVLGITTFFCTRWLTGGLFAPTLAGAVAIAMPWRIAELSHVQLLAAHWFPLAWLGVARVACCDATGRTVAWLAVVLAVQALSSFYLAYFLIASSGVLVAVLFVTTRPTPRTLGQLAMAAAPAGLLLLLLGLPYLRWQASAGFVPLAVLFDSVSLADAWRMFGPSFEFGLRGALPRPVGWQIPVVVFALAASGLALAIPRAADDVSRQRRGFALGLFAVCVTSAVLAVGRELDVGGHAIPLPGHFLAELVPGYANMRNPLRWAIPIGIAFPILAGVGAREIGARLSSAAGPRGQATAVATNAVLVALLVISMPVATLPAAPVWERPEATQRAYAALAALPEGPVIEVPWPLQPQRDVDLASQYMLASTLHWRPIANGTSGYIPTPYMLVRQIAQGLPDRVALEPLKELIGARWIVVHRNLLGREGRAAWDAAEAEGRLRRVFADRYTRIYEIDAWASGGASLEAMASPAPRPRTLRGVSRAPLDLGPDDGRITARVPGRFLYLGARRVPLMVELEIENRTPDAWPGFDPQPDGLVRVRYAFSDAEGRPALVETTPLAADVPGGDTLRVAVPVSGPAIPGSLRLTLDLVQRVGETDRPLPIPAITLDAESAEGVFGRPQ